MFHQTQVDDLSSKLDVTHKAVIGFLEILDERAVPLEKLPETLAEIAYQHRKMLDQLAALKPEDSTTKVFIEQAQAAILEFRYSCFISYSSKDEAFAKRLHADLQDKGVRCWFAPEDMRIGDKIRTRIDEVIRVHDKLLLILSQNSVTSAWVEKEVETAFDKENERKKPVLFPIRLDAAVMESKTGWAADIRRSRHIGDFCNWKDHNHYQKGLERLLRDLKVKKNSEQTNLTR